MKLRMNVVATTLAVVGAAAVISACDREPTAGMPAIGDRPIAEAPATATPSTTPASAPAADPSLPPADQVLAEKPAPDSGSDSKANAPLNDLPKREESGAMPKALQGNNYSTPRSGSL
jgi:hypothetical protein